MDGRANIGFKDAWEYGQDRGLDLFCGIEGVRRCDVLNRCGSERTRTLRVRSRKEFWKHGMAAAAALAIGLLTWKR